VYTPNSLDKFPFAPNFCPERMMGIGPLMHRAQGHDHAAACRDERRSPIQLAVQSSAAPASAVTPAQHGGENIAMAKFYDAVALVGRIPVWTHPAAEWLPPRPLTQLLDRNILTVSL